MSQINRFELTAIVENSPAAYVVMADISGILASARDALNAKGVIADLTVKTVSVRAQKAAKAPAANGQTDIVDHINTTIEAQNAASV